ncbi:MAG: OmpA family protein [Saprospiraceae bacterium]|nr:OmpA family protein [Candidatus Opimibacter iunctus]
MNKSNLFIYLMMLAIITFPSCNTSNQTKGAVIGAGAGAAAGALLGKDNKAVAIILGAAVGGVAGGLIGNYMDKQAAKIQDDLEGATVERVGEGILITFDSGILFDIASYSLKPATRSNLDKLSVTMEKYNETEIRVLGHTDDTGTEKYNATLSKNRAGAVNTYLVSKGVASSRLTNTGYGELDPIATNETIEGREMNRRVEIVIVADKKLQRAAKNGDLTME